MYWEKNKFLKMAAFEKFFVFRLFADAVPMAPSIDASQPLPSIVAAAVGVPSTLLEHDGIGSLSFNLSLSFAFVMEHESGSCS